MRDIEQEHFDSFRLATRALGLKLPEAQKNVNDPPDFLIQYEGKRVGIEHTQVLKGTNRTPSPRQIEQLYRDLSDAIEQELNAKGAKLFVTPTFSCSDFRRLDIPAFASRLAQLAIHMADTQEPYRQGAECAPYYKVTVSALQTARGSIVVYSASGGVDVHPVLEIQQALDRKGQNSTIERCRSKDCDEIWLLLVAEGDGPSSFIEPAEKSLHNPFRSSADRAFILYRNLTRAAELSLSGSATTRQPNAL